MFWNLAITDNAAELRIDGDIVDDSWAWIYEWLGEASASPNKFRQELKKADGKPLTVIIDSYGGDVIAAAGIYHALKEYKGKKTVKIDGKAMSAASVIAMAGDTIEMGQMSIMMIHNPWTTEQGDAHAMRHSADVLDAIKESILNAYQSKTGRSRDAIAAMMDTETWMDAATAVKEGFADKVCPLMPDETKKKAMNFARQSFQNSGVKSMEKLLEMVRAKAEVTDPDPIPETEPVVEPTGEEGVETLNDSRLVSVNLYQTQILLNRRKCHV